MLDAIVDALLDSLKLLPFLLIAYLIMEYIEHKTGEKTKNVIKKSGKFGPFLGAILGIFPQCGFSAAASNLFAGRVITLGTLIAIYLSTSDEMLPVLISEHVPFTTIVTILAFKLFIGMIAGFVIDICIRLIKNRKEKESKEENDKVEEEIGHICEKEHCHCSKKGIFLSSIIHTLKICLFILIANLIINIIIFKVGEDNLSHLLLHKNIFVYFLASLIGLIPNCASSVIMTELYLSNVISIGSLLSGLLTGSGLGILLLFKTNKNIKENLLILSIIYSVGVIVGILVDFIL